ncbi:MAG TPA: hypothetical protein DD706_24085 [Nitrospiraceae bacterium]|nr:hypothetical protein [Nitrospiraceae bacterium]
MLGKPEEDEKQSSHERASWTGTLRTIRQRGLEMQTGTMADHIIIGNSPGVLAQEILPKVVAHTMNMIEQVVGRRFSCLN